MTNTNENIFYSYFKYDYDYEYIYYCVIDLGDNGIKVDDKGDDDIYDGYKDNDDH